MNKRALIAIASFTVLVVSFQNCSRPTKLPDDVNQRIGKGADDAATVSQKLVPSQTEFIEFPENPIGSTLRLNVKSGAMIVLDDEGKEVAGRNYCLSQTEIDELSGILSVASVCEPEELNPKPDFCSMEYEYPYAILLSQSESVALGERRNGCEKPRDLCGEQSNMLKGFLSFIQNHLSEKVCKFESL